jgi:hypothetical protein
MRGWFGANSQWLICLIFLGGGVYSQVLANARTLEERKLIVDKVPLLVMQVNTHQRSLEELAKGSTAQYREFLDKLDAVISRLDKRDEMQTDTINSLMIDVHVLKAKAK